MSRYLLGAAIVALALSAGCKREESRTTTAPSPPPTTPQPAEKAATPPSTPGTATGDAGRTAGQTLDDAGITAKVKTALAASPDVKAIDINVDTVNGKVTLKGNVESQTQVDRAMQIARGTEGVKDVDNQLIVTAGKK